MQNAVACLVKTDNGETFTGVTGVTEVECIPDMKHRKQIAIHHSATHLLHSILHKHSFPETVYKQSLQTGSHITDHSFTFDFYAGFLTQQLKQDFIQTIEKEMNELASQSKLFTISSVVDLTISRNQYSSKEIREFPKYSFVGDISTISKKDSIIHTVSIGNQSREFCCGRKNY